MKKCRKPKYLKYEYRKKKLNKISKLPFNSLRGIYVSTSDNGTPRIKNMRRFSKSKKSYLKESNRLVRLSENDVFLTKSNIYKKIYDLKWTLY